MAKRQVFFVLLVDGEGLCSPTVPAHDTRGELAAPVCSRFRLLFLVFFSGMGAGVGTDRHTGKGCFAPVPIFPGTDFLIV